MFAATDTAWAPWYIARTDDKQHGRVDIITHLLTQIPYKPLTPATSPCPDASPPTATPSPTCPCTTSPHRSRQQASRRTTWRTNPTGARAGRWLQRGAGDASGTGVAVDAPGTPAPVTQRQRWLARLAFAAALAAAVVLLLAGGLKSLTALLVGVAGLAIVCAAAWWFLTHRGIGRWLAAALLVAAPVAVIVVYIAAGLLWEIALTAVLAIVAVAAGRAALSPGQPTAKPREDLAVPQRQPFVIMNPRSGRGKVAKFGLAGKAADLGAEVVLLEGPGVVDVAALAREAVDAGAERLGVAGGDGTQALVAGIAAGRDIR